MKTRDYDDIREKLNIMVNCFFVSDVVLMRDRYELYLDDIRDTIKEEGILDGNDEEFNRNIETLFYIFNRRFEEFLSIDYDVFWKKYDLSRLENEVMGNLGYEKRWNGWRRDDLRD